ncbi:transcriptional regulator, TetR family [Thiohalorhabdus denitrificans]|uniref:Transcriptional regulator, TetR family n=1 Tax=Thiohalorhabdus denitrificans TaxID=381306 RepID=A0A1G5D755_9GAMM|nr:transcriptional regulator, TetR family [Thiohalorhabdus denitrificans]
MGRLSSAREELITTAADELWQGSYGSVGVGALCSAAGVKRGSFYYFFDSKDDLVLAALEHSWERMQAQFERVLGDESVPPLQRLPRFFDAVAEMHDRVRQESGHVPGCPFGNLSVELGNFHDPIRERVADIFRRATAHFAGLLRAAHAAGEIPLESPEEAERRAEQIFGAMQGAQVLAKTHADPDAIRRMAPVAVAIARGDAES